ncbi:hypothetical protein [Bacillus mycoides]|uniref:hypothetical protein n=1 Tax=Bacillus mycoides TaxID=1405 RepID=UPI000BF7566A|nr:hypothetical protein [Bacillus mycoides]PGA05664.1 hypothetical protein COL71_26065 [Bacillus mycoides]
MINVAVSITKNEAGARNTLIQYYESRYSKDKAREQLLQDFCKDKHARGNEFISKFVSRLSLNEFIQVFIYDNYEVIKSKEEQLANYYESVGNGVDGIAIKLNIEKVLEILQIKIKGINE